jgi:hypothetical protein
MIRFGGKYMGRMRFGNVIIIKKLFIWEGSGLVAKYMGRIRFGGGINFVKEGSGLMAK